MSLTFVFCASEAAAASLLPSHSCHGEHPLARHPLSFTFRSPVTGVFEPAGVSAAKGEDVDLVQLICVAVTFSTRKPAD